MATAKEVVVTGISLTTALGNSASENWTRLMAGESAIALRQPFVDLAPGPLAMIGKRPASLTKMVRQLAQQAWHDAGLATEEVWRSRSESTLESASESVSKDCGVVIGSSRSSLQVLELMAAYQREFPGQLAGNWLEALAHSPALNAANAIGATGPLLAPMAACATGIWAVAQAANLIRSGQCQRVVAGAVEAPITPLTVAGFRKMGALAPTGCYPFDTAREGFVLGEGGALMVLESADVAAARGARIYGKVLGAGMTNDSHHISSFDPSYEMGKRAVQRCLEQSQLWPEEIDAVHTHGTSTVQNDRMEAALIQNLMAKRNSKPLPVMSSKGATGHTLGASGAVITVLGLVSLWRQEAIPCVGLSQAAFDLDFVQSGQPTVLRNLLCFSFGFGGQNAVLALASAAND
ncbi:beta-ketoacyl-ACP synthase [cf. Phormidesmis sp. LEGE 11477]|uniref:beta-ketoacyl-ACP synthase n=1 Tax=cf. Phormidesmis sp. LEGE 11477 TaxID=1828680 RepID=UPI00187F2470|nr:beta-ketoacyl-ACP synthase [cf. Phormidesmis sp. LEGE 11477]